MDTKLIQDQITGLVEKLDQLREDEKVFIKAQGIETAEAKLRGEVWKKKKDLEQKTADLKALRIVKAEAVNESCRAMSDKVGRALPHGTALFQISDNKVFIGWDNAPYDSLYGSQKRIFDGALAGSLGADILIYEFAELDVERMDATLKSLSEIDEQVICCAWVPPTGGRGDVNYDVPDSWTIVNLEGERQKDE